MFETTPERSRLDGGGRRPVSEDLEKGLVSYQTKKYNAYIEIIHTVWVCEVIVNKLELSMH